MQDNPQLKAWQGGFGDSYIERSRPTEAMVETRTGMWRRILEPIEDRLPKSVLEVGPNLGANILGLRGLTPLLEAQVWAVEPNGAAREGLIADGVLAADRVLEGHAGAIPLDDGAVDLVFTRGVLIHIAPENLLDACREMHRVSGRYLLSIEYFADKPEAIPYRGESDLLFKRDYGAFWLENFPDLKVAGYGFFWRPVDRLDNTNWWLFEKP